MLLLLYRLAIPRLEMTNEKHVRVMGRTFRFFPSIHKVPGPVWDPAAAKLHSDEDSSQLSTYRFPLALIPVPVVPVVPPLSLLIIIYWGNVDVDATNSSLPSCPPCTLPRISLRRPCRCTYPSPAFRQRQDKVKLLHLTPLHAYLKPSTQSPSYLKEGI